MDFQMVTHALLQRPATERPDTARTQEKTERTQKERKTDKPDKVRNDKETLITEAKKTQRWTTEAKKMHSTQEQYIRITREHEAKGLEPLWKCIIVIIVIIVVIVIIVIIVISIFDGAHSSSYSLPSEEPAASQSLDSLMADTEERAMESVRPAGGSWTFIPHRAKQAFIQYCAPIFNTLERAIHDRDPSAIDDGFKKVLSLPQKVLRRGGKISKTAEELRRQIMKKDRPG
jgi:hypothetical protein